MIKLVTLIFLVFIAGFFAKEIRQYSKEILLCFLILVAGFFAVVSGLSKKADYDEERHEGSDKNNKEKDE